MADYNLDALGWKQFERLVQAVLKAKISPAIEATAGRGDHGRDAWYAGELEFPEKGRLNDGPFVFQMKFVEGANAAGARPSRAVKKAVAAEVALINTRRQPRGNGEATPTHYVFITNAPLSSGLRSEIATVFGKAYPKTNIVTWGSSDLDGLLDSSPDIRASYPQILGVRDLDSLLRKVVQSHVIERSSQALALASDVARVFVPTPPYYAARAMLRHRHMVVLTGPPEAGKTAIARMISLTNLTNGWEAYELTSPDELFSLLDRSSQQVFIADDAFGSTEYSPAYADAWAREMEKIVRAVDGRHWVIFTTRPAPLNEALRVLNFQGEARHFPQPTTVTVNVLLLSRMDRALILYRHAKAAGLAPEVVDFLKKHAMRVVDNPQFTPLRVQRLIEDDLPGIADLPDDEQEPALVAAVARGLREPTRAMRTSFNALSPEHRGALISMLDVPAGAVSSSDLEEALRRHLPKGMSRPPMEIIQSLDEHFVRIRESEQTERLDDAY